MTRLRDCLDGTSPYYRWAAAGKSPPLARAAAGGPASCNPVGLAKQSACTLVSPQADFLSLAAVANDEHPRGRGPPAEGRRKLLTPSRRTGRPREPARLPDGQPGRNLPGRAALRPE